MSRSVGSPSPLARGVAVATLAFSLFVAPSALVSGQAGERPTLISDQSPRDPELASDSLPPAAPQGTVGNVQEVGIDIRSLVGEPAGPPRQGGALDEVSDELASVMRCPVCQGLSIADSPSMMAIDMRAKVRQMLADGYSPEQVMAYFEARYGEFVRLAPKAEGFNLLVWIAPVAALALGLLIVGVYLRRRQAGDGGEEADTELESYAERVRREVGS